MAKDGVLATSHIKALTKLETNGSHGTKRFYEDLKYYSENMIRAMVVRAIEKHKSNSPRTSTLTEMDICDVKDELCIMLRHNWNMAFIRD